MTIEKGNLTFVERASKREKFDKRIIQHIVNLIESGMLQKAAAQKYGAHPDTVRLWLNKYGSAVYQETRRKVFTISQKRSIVRSVHGGMSVIEAQRTFNISSPGIIRKWLREFTEENSEISLAKVSQMSKKPKEIVPANILALQKALDEANLKIKALDTLIDVAEEKLQINIRKKSGARQSSK